MNHADWARAVALYFPTTVAILSKLLCGARPRQFAACLLSVLWTAPSLLVLQRWNQFAGWWSFAPGSAFELRGMPLELFCGWVILWGIIPHLALQRLNIFWAAAVMLAADCILMPLAGSIVTLSPMWPAGEVIGVVLVLLPALCLGRWTFTNARLRTRALLQIAAAGLVFLFLIPEIAFALRPGPGWAPLLDLPGWLRQLALQCIFLLAVPGISATLEFAERGAGTPIPYDPPKRLVTSGVYRYCCNPMQFSCALVITAWAGLLRNGWMLLAAAISIVYSAGIAEWDEREDLTQRFGSNYSDYRSAVGAWWPKWLPYHAGPLAILYMAGTCDACREVRAWLERRKPSGLLFVDAETLPAGSIQRVRYDPADGSGTVDGVRAIARALEHIHPGWAFGGMCLRLPVLWKVIQFFMDASGLGPRSVDSQHESGLDLSTDNRSVKNGGSKSRCALRNAGSDDPENA